MRLWVWCLLVVWSLELHALTWMLASIVSLSPVVELSRPIFVWPPRMNELTLFMLDQSSEDSSNYSSYVCAAKAKKAAERSAHGDQSSLPLSSLPEHSDLKESEPDTKDEGPSPSCKRRKTSAVKNNNMSGCNGSELPFSKKLGTLSNKALEEICIFSDEVKVKANQLGQQFDMSAVKTGSLPILSFRGSGGQGTV